MTSSPVLVLGWGNPSRGDDALGPLCLEQLRERLGESGAFEFLEDFQLQVEHALDLVGRQRVLFVDASLNCAAPFAVSTVQATQDASYSTHALSPAAVLDVFQRLQSGPPPPCTLLAIRGEHFELGEAMSAQAQANLAQAVDWAYAWLQGDTSSASKVPPEFEAVM